MRYHRGVTLHIKDFPEDLRFKARAAANKRHEPLKDFVARAIEREIERVEQEESE
jgi:hypothetical protein